MNLTDIKDQIPPQIFDILTENGIETLRPSQEKAIEQGLFQNKSLLICTPTASGKTLIGELAATKKILENKGKAIYIVPLKALASEKYKEFKKKYDKVMKIALSIGDNDKKETYLANYDLIICTAEKLDSLIRHHSPWLSQVSIVIVDEIHLLNDRSRGPTLEILITILKSLLKNLQIIGLSATIGNPEDLADWLGADLVQDTWRPVPLYKGVYYNKEIVFDDL